CVYLELLPCAQAKNRTADHDQHIGKKHAYEPAAPRQALHHRFDSDVGALAEREHCANECQPHEEKTCHFLVDHQALIEAIAKHDIGEHHDAHTGQCQHQQHFEKLIEKLLELFHSVLPPSYCSGVPVRPYAAAAGDGTGP